MSEYTVAKYGGTSMAQPELVADIVEARPDQQFIIVSAPGKAPGMEVKMTDELIKYGKWYVNAAQGVSELKDEIIDRFDSLYSMLGGKDRASLRQLADRRLKPAYSELRGDGVDHFAAQGEFLSAMYFACLIGASAVEPAICFDANGQLDMSKTRESIKSQNASRRRNQPSRRVIPGFYGDDSNRKIHLLGRGGSDRTMAIYGGILGLDCENWTDVDGIYSTDPRFIPGAKLILELTREEVREGAHGGSGVLQGDTILDLGDSTVGVHMRNTFNPAASGTKIVATSDQLRLRKIDPDNPIVALSGRSLLELTVRDMGMARQIGHLEKLLHHSGEFGVSIEHMPAAQDAATFTFSADTNREALERFRSSIADHAISNIAEVTVSEKGVVYVVGEALRCPRTGTRTLGRIATLLCEHDLAFEAPVSHPMSPSLALLVAREAVQPILEVLHREFIENPAA